MSKTSKMSRIYAVELFQNGDEWRLTVGVNGQFWALLLPAGAQRDFISAGIPVREPPRKCWACNGRGGHYEPAIAHTDTWHTCDVCKGAKVRV